MGSNHYFSELIAGGLQQNKAIVKPHYNLIHRKYSQLKSLLY